VTGDIAKRTLTLDLDTKKTEQSNALATLWAELSSSFGSFFIALRKLFWQVAAISKDALIAVWKKMVEVLGPYLAWVADHFHNFLEWLGSLAKSIGGQEFFESVAEGMRMVKNLLVRAAQAARSAGQTLLAQISESFQELKESLGNVWDEIMGLIGIICDNLVDIVSSNLNPWEKGE